MISLCSLEDAWRWRRNSKFLIMKILAGGCRSEFGLRRDNVLMLIVTFTTSWHPRDSWSWTACVYLLATKWFLHAHSNAIELKRVVERFDRTPFSHFFTERMREFECISIKKSNGKFLLNRELQHYYHHYHLTLGQHCTHMHTVHVRMHGRMCRDAWSLPSTSASLALFDNCM